MKLRHASTAFALLVALAACGGGGGGNPGGNPMPTVTTAPPATNGDYRLLTIDPVAEAPCLTDFNAARASLNLPPVVEDEWLAENQREFLAYRVTPGFHVAPYPGNPFGVLTTGNSGGGGNDCSSVAGAGTVAFQPYPSPEPSFGRDPQTQWFAGDFDVNGPGSRLAIYAGDEFPVDPREYVDPNVPHWP